jgi:phosphatidylinositol glycan class B
MERKVSPPFFVRFPAAFLTCRCFSVRSLTRIALLIAAITFTLRPTNLVLWVFLGAQLVYSRWTSGQRNEAGQVIIDAVWIGSVFILPSFLARILKSLCTYCRLVVLLPSTLLDTFLFPPPAGSTLPFTFPFLPFLTYNIFLPTSLFYGSNPWHYYLFQAIPILLLPSLPLALTAFLAGARGRLGGDARLLAGLIGWTVAVYSMIGHKEWRFLHPLVPVFHVLTARWLMGTGKAWVIRSPAMLNPAAVDGSNDKERVICTLPRKSWTLSLVLVPIAPIVYLSLYHGRAQHAVINRLRHAGPAVSSIGVLMPCHSTPWQSHLHRQDLDNKSWFLTCDPPKGFVAPSTLPVRGLSSH